MLEVKKQKRVAAALKKIRLSLAALESKAAALKEQVDFLESELVEPQPAAPETNGTVPAES